MGENTTRHAVEPKKNSAALGHLLLCVIHLLNQIM
jgi:hypothetical protein